VYYTKPGLANDVASLEGS